MSSNTYSTELTPDPFLRRVVLCSGVAAATIGIVLVIALPIATYWRVGMTLAWLALNGRDLALIVQGFKRCRRIRLLHDGSAAMLIPDGSWVPATLRPGSVVLARIAWLRFEAHDGSRFSELIRGNSAKNQHWRRLQVIWRHLGAGG